MRWVKVFATVWFILDALIDVRGAGDVSRLTGKSPDQGQMVSLTRGSEVRYGSIHQLMVFWKSCLHLSVLTFIMSSKDFLHVPWTGCVSLCVCVGECSGKG